MKRIPCIRPLIQPKQGLRENDSTFLSDKSALFARNLLTQTTPHPPEPNAEKLAYYAEASRMSMERSFVRLQTNNYFVKISDFETRRNEPFPKELNI